jgi:methylmalonyl-CoA mutase
MSKIGQVVEAVEKHGRFVVDQVKRARSDEKFGRELVERWNKIKNETPITRAPTGLPLPRLALPEIDEPGEIARYLFGDGLPGEFPFLNGAYREMYLEPLEQIEQGTYGNKKSTRLRQGSGAAEQSKVAKAEKPQLDLL